MCICFCGLNMLWIVVSICGVRIVVNRFCSMWLLISIVLLLVSLYSVDVSMKLVMLIMNMCLCLYRLLRCLLVIWMIVFVYV